ncbi:MAG: hypothetical protein IK104_05465 [Clostridia bacterium]|nr:hypothetical protein [Clostridia bacterium]
MKAYETDAGEILARAKAARLKTRRRNAVLGTALALTLIAAGVLALRHAGLSIKGNAINLPGTAENTRGEATAADLPTETVTEGDQPTLEGTASDTAVWDKPSEEPDMPPTEEGTTSDAAEIATVPHWDEADAPRKYPAFTRDGAEYYVRETPVDAAYVGETLFGVTLTGQDIYTETIHTFEGEARRIAGVDPAAGVAVTLPDGKAYAYVNPWYEPATLGALVDALALREGAVFGPGYSDYFEDGTYVSRVYEDFDDAIVWEMLLNDLTPENRGWNAKTGARTVDVSISVPRIGAENLSLAVTEDGYLVTNVAGSAAVFYLGTEKTQAFEAYLSSHVDYTDTPHYVPPAEDPPETEAPREMTEVWSSAARAE